MNINTNFNIGERIHELRIQSGLSQEKLALRANITTTYLGLLERNLKNPTVKVVEQICNQLNISLGDFFSSSRTPENPADTISLQIIAQVSDRSEEEKLLILQTIKDISRLCDISKNQAIKNFQSNIKEDNIP
ncbi:MAG: helix-turn-helix domain-containing protein [Lachnospiraceae bacterium]|nr:helix-turn-helix domain-containing protein [Lachnospiraceae bacterium]